MRHIKTLATAAGLLAAAAMAHALDGENGYTATELFQWGAVRGQIQYDTSFTGVRWADMAWSHLGGNAGENAKQMAVDADGDLYYMVSGQSAGKYYSGLIRTDGTTHTSVMQGSRVDLSSGELPWQVRIAPATAGGLTAGHPVVLRHQPPWEAAEIVSVDPDTGAQTVLHTITTLPDRPPWRFDVAADGCIYALHTDGTIGKLSYDGPTGDYVESVVPTSLLAGSDIMLGPDGALYTFDAATSWGSRDAKPIYRVDPVSGATSVYGDVKRGHEIDDWAFDSSGDLWAGLTKVGRRREYFVARVPPGGSASGGTAISDSTRRPQGLAAGLGGTILVREHEFATDGALDQMLVLTPSAGGGGGGGGNGKGKKK